VTRAIYVEVQIESPLDRVWQLTQEPGLHPRWDARFSSITPIEELDLGYRFRYERRLPFHTIVGTGTSIGERHVNTGARTSALRFTTTDRLSPIRAGRGYWRYVPTPTGVTFISGYDYTPGWGALLDRLVMRRVIGWLTAWSFDRLRIWAETGVVPERWPLAAALWFWKTDRPRAARARRVPRRGLAMDDAPASLERLAAP
jgi:hypothetical protein